MYLNTVIAIISAALIVNSYIAPVDETAIDDEGATVTAAAVVVETDSGNNEND